MSTSNPATVAAAPVLVAAFTDMKAAVTTILTGDPLQIPARLGPAVAILDNQLLLLLPELADVEEPVVLTDVTSGIDSIISKLQKLVPASAPAAPAAPASTSSSDAPASA